MDVPSKTALRRYGSTAARNHSEGRALKPKTVTVDLHNHLRVPAAADLVKPHLPKDHHALTQFANKLTREVNEQQGRDRLAHFTDIEQRLIDMDQMGLDVMAVSCSPPQMYYALDPSLGHESSQLINDTIAVQTKKHPKRFLGLGTVPLQDTDLAIRELDRCVNELGFRGIQIGARVRDEELSAERFEPFWSRCEELDIVVFIHPSSFASPRLSRHYLVNVIGNPLDTTVAVHYLIFDGVIARHPKLKIYLSHGGGFAAAYGARMDHAFGARPDCREHIGELPSTYLRSLYVDTVVFSLDQLDYLVKKFGADHVALGTDYPADMGEYDPIEHVCQSEHLSESDREKICGLNALRLMNLDERHFEHQAAPSTVHRSMAIASSS
jgi:aminocarboxymuconate-semialdehyde decarboxylase